MTYSSNFDIIISATVMCFSKVLPSRFQSFTMTAPRGVEFDEMITLADVLFKVICSQRIKTFFCYCSFCWRFWCVVQLLCEEVLEWFQISGTLVPSCFGARINKKFESERNFPPSSNDKTIHADWFYVRPASWWLLFDSYFGTCQVSQSPNKQSQTYMYVRYCSPSILEQSMIDSVICRYWSRRGKISWECFPKCLYCNSALKLISVVSP